MFACMYLELRCFDGECEWNVNNTVVNFAAKYFKP